jgi:predicted RNase H-like HicB family nuclease
MEALMRHHMATIEFTININCCVGRDEDSEVYVSHCPTLDVYSQGETEEEALEAIKSAVTLHITTAFDFNRLEKVLRKAGFEKFSSGKQIEPETAPAATEYVHVRFSPEMKQVPISLPLRLSAQQCQYASAG